jgi:CO/xanthine dehydrogenase Mo-binding subunit
MNAPLPAQLEANPELDRWVAFPAPGQVTVLTGRVELGQGVLTAMRQIAADELDVSIERITIRSGDTIMAPNEGYTAGSQSIQFGGVAMRQACADVRALFVTQAAKVLGCKAAELSIRDGSILRNGASTGQDYWTLAGAVNLTAKARLRSQEHRRKQCAHRSAGESVRRSRLYSRYAARRHGACARCAPAQPRRKDRHDRRKCNPPRRQGAG